MSRRPSHAAPPRALMVTLMLCLTALLLGYLTYPGISQNPVAVDPSHATTPAPVAMATPTPTPKPTPVPTPVPTASPSETGPESPEVPVSPSPFPDRTPLPEDSDIPLPGVTPDPNADYSQPIPKGEEADPETWFKDAVFIGDSRTDGLHLYSGIKGGTYLVHTGLTVFDVNAGKAVLGSGEEKYSVLSALKRKQYGKVYIALGINELGWFDAEAYAEAVGKLIDSIRERQKSAVIYVQAIVPVSPAVCKSHGQPYYVTNENITSYNAALQELCGEKQVWYVNISEALVDETGELPADMTHDGVHFKKAGYQAWLEYLLCHTGEGLPAPEETPEPTPEPTPTPIPTPRPEMPPEAPEATPEVTPAPVG